jgi:hypothetical protein
LAGLAEQKVPGGVAEESLEEELVEGAGGVQQTDASGLSDLAAEVEDRGAVERVGGPLLQASE